MRVTEISTNGHPGPVSGESPDSGNECFNVALVIFLFRAELLDQIAFFQTGFVAPGEDHQRGSDQSGHYAKDIGCRTMP